MVPEMHMRSSRVRMMTDLAGHGARGMVRDGKEVEVDLIHEVLPQELFQVLPIPGVKSARVRYSCVVPIFVPNYLNNRNFFLPGNTNLLQDA